MLYAVDDYSIDLRIAATRRVGHRPGRAVLSTSNRGSTRSRARIIDLAREGETVSSAVTDEVGVSWFADSARVSTTLK